MAQIPRLFLDADYMPGMLLPCTHLQAHYLRQVLRLNENAEVEIFNGRDGSWRAHLRAMGKKDAQLELAATPRRSQQPVPDVWLVCSPLRQNRLDWLVEKATELGVARICPIVTQRSAVRQINGDRLRQITIEAAEQCDWDAIPVLAELQTLPQCLGAWPKDRPLLLADETGQGKPAKEILSAIRTPLAIAIGPEGGWTEEELAMLSSQSMVQRIGLGPRILRAETAAIALLSALLASTGAWDAAPRFAQE